MSSNVMNSEGERPVVLITAGASGIGRCMAESFLSANYDVHVCDISESAVSAFLEANPSASATVADISCVDQVASVFADLRSRHGRLDVLVNNAGIAGPTALVEDIDPDGWDQCIAVDLNGQFYCTRLAVPLLKKRGKGAIINIASNAAFFGFPMRSAYTAAKWAMIGLTKTWAMELGPHNIRVNALCPCSVNGPRIDGVIAREAEARGVEPDVIRQLYQSQSSLRLFVDAEDVANMALYLCSPMGAKISGQVLGIDGHTESLAANF